MGHSYNSIADLRESAPLALAFAAEHCAPGPGPSPTCAWYHGVWQYFRLLDLVATPWKQENFFRAVFRELAVSGQYRRVLICGSSDYAMLALLLSAYREEGTDPEVTVIDRCETPLFLNRWFAGRQGLSLATSVGDALHHAAAAPYDLLCTHSFLGNFSPAQRTELLANWTRLLRPGGRLVTVQRIRPGATGRTAFSAAQAARFREKVREGCRAWPPDLGISPAELLARAELYCAGYASYPVSSRVELLDLFASHGFRVASVSEEAGGKVADGGPATPGQGGRVQLVLQRGWR